MCNALQAIFCIYIYKYLYLYTFISIYIYMYICMYMEPQAAERFGGGLGLGSGLSVAGFQRGLEGCDRLLMDSVNPEMLGGEEWRRPQLLLQVEPYLPTDSVRSFKMCLFGGSGF